MRFLLDSDLSFRLGELFAAAGHDVIHVDSVGLGQAPDPDIAAYARENDRCVITADFDFADLREYEPREYAGLIVFTLHRSAGPAYIERLAGEVIRRLSEIGPVKGKLIVVEPGRIRVRD